jgi:hypothetical protein
MRMLDLAASGMGVDLMARSAYKTDTRTNRKKPLPSNISKLRSASGDRY